MVQQRRSCSGTVGDVGSSPAEEEDAGALDATRSQVIDEDDGRALQGQLRPGGSRQGHGGADDAAVLPCVFAFTWALARWRHNGEARSHDMARMEGGVEWLRAM
jgi:hypothetical protein